MLILQLVLPLAYVAGLLMTPAVPNYLFCLYTHTKPPPLPPLLKFRSGSANGKGQRPTSHDRWQVVKGKEMTKKCMEIRHTSLNLVSRSSCRFSIVSVASLANVVFLWFCRQLPYFCEYF